ncbi:hypothetical protein ACFWXD_17525 [[Kitasatospora] papulosa]|uniref:hypothetical protein n=1 Tax=[Kitasatospora] papulosa TaxID=1464011 RepID=UPI0036B9AA59
MIFWDTEAPLMAAVKRTGDAFRPPTARRLPDATKGASLKAGSDGLGNDARSAAVRWSFHRRRTGTSEEVHGSVARHERMGAAPLPLARDPSGWRQGRPSSCCPTGVRAGSFWRSVAASSAGRSQRYPYWSIRATRGRPERWMPPVCDRAEELDDGGQDGRVGEEREEGAVEIEASAEAVFAVGSLVAARGDVAGQQYLGGGQEPVAQFRGDCVADDRVPVAFDGIDGACVWGDGR